MDYRKKELIAEGKTKRVFSVQDRPTMVILEAKDDITAFDDPSLTQLLPGKAEAATTTTCQVFRQLQSEHVPVAYLQQLGAKEFLAYKCQMIPLEVVARRNAVGSILQRCPELIQAVQNDGHQPARFDKPLIEFFLKTTNGRLSLSDGQVLVQGLDPAKGEEDPYIINPGERYWRLQHPKQRLNTPEANLDRQVDSQLILGGESKFKISEMALFAKMAFIALEKAWEKTHKYRLIDFKLEFGFCGHDLVIADVIDSDSWRLWTPEGQDVSKQVYRDGGALETVLYNYQHVAELAKQFAA